ncbi:MAG: HepT-like ribonuclease domain-containing protein [archaeon]
MKDKFKDDRVYLTHLMENIQKIESSFKGTTKEEYAQDVDLQDATFRRVEIIGSAAKNVSKKTKEKHPEVKWAKIAGARDKLIPGYAMVDKDIVYRINEDIIELKKQVLEMLEELNKEAKEK